MILKPARLHILMSIAFAMMLGACSSGPPPRLYLLEAPAIIAGNESDELSSLQTLGISQITLPGYATDTRIASVDSKGVVVQMDSERWAEDPEAAITRYLANRLRQQANATVMVEPWPRDYIPQARVEINMGRLLREPDGGVSMSGQILLLSGDGRALLQSVPFEHRVVGRATASVEFFKAVAVGIDELVRLAVESLLIEKRQS